MVARSKGGTPAGPAGFLPLGSMLIHPAPAVASIRLSKALKKMGWAFVGPTTVYAFMQAMGLINDHAEGCAIRAQVEAARQNFVRPGSP